MAEYLISERALGAAALSALREGLLSSPLVGRSTLAGSFRGSYGFAVTFTEAGREELLHRFPALGPALEALSAPRELRGDAPNAWYLNLLSLPKGQGVGKHTDGTLRGPAGSESLLPRCVSVLYLVAPEGSGALEIYEGERVVRRIEPAQGMIVHFDGALEHAVLASDHERISLVLEQYAVAAEDLPKLPAFKLDSRAGFGAYLKDHASRPARKLDLE